MYMFAIKDANSLISQLTDDDLGTVLASTSRRITRVDYAIRPNIAFQNLLFLQTERRSSNPARHSLCRWARDASHLGAISARSQFPCLSKEKPEAKESQKPEWEHSSILASGFLGFWLPFLSVTTFHNSFMNR